MSALTITQTAGTLVVETKRGENVTTATYNLDGTESTNTTPRGESKSKAGWDDDPKDGVRQAVAS